MSPVSRLVFEADKNPQLLISDIVATINKDGTISAHVPYVLPHKQLIPNHKIGQ